MSNSRKLLGVCAMAALILTLSAVVFATTLFPHAMVKFDGFQIVKNNSNTNKTTMQGFVDITLKNIEATGVSFCLEIDTTKVLLSDAVTNEPIYVNNSGEFDISHAYFKQDLDMFPENVFQDNTDLANKLPSSYIPDLSLIGITNQMDGNNTSQLRMNFVPQEGSENICGNIQMIDGGRKIMANDDDLHIGIISFKIVDPVAFAKFTPTELEEAIKVVSFSKISSSYNNDNNDNGTTIGVSISYVKDGGRVGLYEDSKRNIGYDLSLNFDISDVQPQTKELTVSSYEIYNNESIDDLYDFLNEKMSVVTVTYADDSQKSDIFTWDPTKSTIVSGPSKWNPKGGTDYTVKQPYFDTGYYVEATVHIKPVNLIDFDMDDESKTYLYGETGFPSTFGGLTLPKVASPVLDTYIPNGGAADVPIGWYSLDPSADEVQSLPSDFSDGSAHSYVYKCHFTTPVEQAITSIPWLTATTGMVTDILNNHPIYRNVVVEETDLPNELEVVSTDTDKNGYLTIIVKNKEKEDGTTPPIPDGTVFDIKMPGGDLIDTETLKANGKYNVTYNDDGTATIVIQPDITSTDNNEKKLSQLVNLGDRAGNFSIASTEPDKNRGEFVDFTTDPRRNLYLKNEKNEDYEFDFSDLLAGMFPVSTGTDLPATITLIRPEDRIRTTYSGYDGTVEGYLKTFTVETDKDDPNDNGWEIISGDTTLEGDVVTVKGKLKDGAAYTNYGIVNNDNDVYVTIKYRVGKNEGTDSIDTILDFVYDPQQEGYGYDLLQSQPFTVHNNGLTELHGLSAVISLSKDNGKEAFSVKKELPQILKSGESADLIITNNIGLPVIDPETNDHTDYVCTVSIFSENSTKPLRTFTISFTVTKNETYDVKITVPDDQKSFGKAQTTNGSKKAQAGKTVEITAMPETDCIFTGWNVISGDITIDDPTNPNASFTMPDEDVEIEAQFEETLGAKLRADDLRVKDKNEKDQALHKADWTLVNFDPATREYYVAVSNDTDEAYLWFKLRAEAENAELTLTHTYDKGKQTDTLAVPIKDTADEYYKSVAIPLKEADDENILTLSISAKDENNIDVEREYKIHIYRKIKNSKLVEFNYGNSPYGLIMRAGGSNTSQMKEQFINNGYQFTAGNTPKDGITGVIYTQKAWKSVNYDLDEYALFVINTEGFVDPGFGTIKNSLGKQVDSADVKKSVTVNTLLEVNNKDGSSEDFVYIESKKIDLPASGMISDLKDLRIRPDCYELKYSFTDFDGKEISVSKPLIVLYPVGDVDVSKQVTNADKDRIRNRFSKDIANHTNVILNNVNTYDEGGLLFKHRVCDVNNDTNVNAIDANCIRAGALTQFYENLN